ncbi:MAG: hypothetical protein ABFC24_01545 [Methanoregulaceae archaeon]
MSAMNFDLFLGHRRDRSGSGIIVVALPWRMDTGEKGRVVVLNGKPVSPAC